MQQHDELLVRFGDAFATLHVRLWRANKPRGTVFCVHGFDGNGSDFDFLAAHLQERDFTVVCPDMLGRGKSTFFHDAARYDFRIYGNCMAAVSKYAGTSNHFVGTSWGGAILIAMLGGTPIKVDRLVLNDVSLRGNPAADDVARFLRQESSMTFERIEDAYAHVRHTRRCLGELSEDAWSSFLRNRIRKDGERYRLAYDPFAVPAFRQERFDRVPLLRRIRADILLMYGAESGFLDPDAIADAQADRQNISFVRVDGAGHPVSLMTPEQADMVCNFLA
ncbi:alpha/beta fold hydrolase [Bradyrhizobium diazoefficiens]|nr:alpha/beta fold hydrolase [Bradyrhizobium diazoefficiens]UCF52011.1 MAG: alpha/beta fold hydrolase [Bradyrhizobium sp.]MBR0964175.1 alpha/beta fold hydrolase [Bradyrhizobium diazoefficiens]MBR0978335.1 alpha/beta fold hydrolase [Bradyrhizobium diazoefficiens]MBR1006266.1 alpha/beta fold hydrolase [Bradyrhizobium diazoefficiens]MBR1014318.1 alpha/beta fold hydrolase [Bradyrhizobium diazoefficiens]